MIYINQRLRVTPEYLAWYLETNGEPSVFTVNDELVVTDSFPSSLSVMAVNTGKVYKGISKHWYPAMRMRWLAYEMTLLGVKRAGLLLDFVDQL